LTTEKQLDKGISDIVGVFTDPILVFPGGWGDSLPDWLKGAITMERLIENMKALKGEQMTGTDAEACAYLMTVSLTQPMDNDWSEIYLYVAGTVYEKHRTKESGATMPGDIRVDHLSDYQMQHLNRLKAWLYERRIKAREEKERAKRREIREEQETKKKDEQPALFEF
jgi:hypothetical protein